MVKKKKLATISLLTSLIKPSRAICLFLMVSVFTFSPLLSFGQTTQIYNTPGTFTFTVPAGVSSVTVECWGAGGAGGGVTSNGGASGAGGAGGAYASKTVAVIAGSSYTINVGQGGNGGNGNGPSGGDSWFSTTGTVIAKGGKGGGRNNGAPGLGTTTGSIGSTVYKGGDGIDGFNYYGAGGGGAGTSGNGGSVITSTSWIGGIGTPIGGGNGGDGIFFDGNGNPGFGAGGGGSGAYTTTNANYSGGNGADGQVIITYYLTPPTISSFTPSSACANTTPIVITGTNFTGTTAVTFGGTNALTFTVNSSTQITATPAAGTTGTIKVTTPSGTATSATSLTVNALPATPTGAASQTFCTSNSPTVASLTASGTSIKWYTAATGGSALASTTVLVDAAHYYATQTNGGGCESTTRFDVTVTLNIPPSTTDATICAGGSGTLTAIGSCGSAAPVTVGPNNAGTAVSTGTGTSWANPGNITTTGSPYASVGLTNSSDSKILRASNFGFSIPTNATINGIVVTINKMVNNTSGTRADVIVQLYNGSSTLVGDNKAMTANWPGSFSDVVYGGISDNWNAGLTAADINNPNFGVAQSAQCSSGTTRTFTVDYIQISVTYSIPGSIDWYTASSGGIKIGSGSPFNPVGVVGSGLVNTNTAGTTNYYAECSLNPGCRTPTNFVIKAIPSAPIIGTITQPDCTLATGSVVLSGLPNAGTWTLTRSGTSSAITTGTGTSTVISGLSAGTYTFTVSNGTCVSGVSGNVVIIAPITNTWNGICWSNGTPNSSQKLVFTGNYPPVIDPNVDLFGCSCKVVGGSNVTIKQGRTMTISNEVTVQAGGTLTFEDQSSLVQINDATVNTGNITYKRMTTVILNTDYTYWSSPVAGQVLQLVSPNTTSANGFYSYDASIDNWKQESATGSMGIGTGYIILGPKTHLAPSFYQATFIGIPNNGIVNAPIGVTNSSNLIGNPYPSALDADKFLSANSSVIEGTIYFWTHNTTIQLAANITNGTAGTGAYAYTSDDYASYNTTGGTSAISGGSKPLGNIAAGQAFFTTSVVPGNAVFNNSMRVDNIGNTLNNSQFFKTKKPKNKTATTIEKSRLWLDLSNSQGAFKQTLVGYITGATNDIDPAYDGVSFDGNEYIDFYSVVQDKNLTIQGRALPFNENDIVPLGFRSTIDGTFAINIDQVDGVLTDQAVFIEDKLTNAIADLKKGAYTFTTLAGTFNDRFVLRYNKTLGIANVDVPTNTVLVSNKNGEIKVNSYAETINKIAIYDLLGREIYIKTSMDNNEWSIANLASSYQTLIVKTTLQNGETVIAKIIY